MTSSQSHPYACVEEHETLAGSMTMDEKKGAIFKCGTCAKVSGLSQPLREEPPLTRSYPPSFLGHFVPVLWMSRISIGLPPPGCLVKPREECSPHWRDASVFLVPKYLQV
ncbi:hypothetical protein M422DRAFT_254865 [Sphaerobolus stellatus SS14]|uniref:Uncharacterized protein n=1 Tax=Sphaerobolus stellatus (strain SS14) TaxID=990650 RepID=A0A0C9UGI0_SPHS4|nr:hypothetical protein M422DRAFT_254865 [Sphaerobolus stellatus SS14]